MSAGINFDWDDQSTVIRSVSAVAVYLNPHGDLVIRQESPLGEDDSVVVIPIDRISTLIKAIRAVAK